MKHPNKPGQFKVVTRNGSFFAAPLGDDKLEEAHASVKERARLATRVGFVNGGHPGLVEEFARALARTLEASRRAKGWRRKKRRA